jgi:hypothetical protein
MPKSTVLIRTARSQSDFLAKVQHIAIPRETSGSVKSTIVRCITSMTEICGQCHMEFSGGVQGCSKDERFCDATCRRVHFLYSSRMFRQNVLPQEKAVRHFAKYMYENESPEEFSY